MSKIIDNYNLVNEGKMAKSEFLRQARQGFPGYINQFTSFDDAISIFKRKGILTEEVEYQCKGDKFPLEQIENGIDYELEQMGIRVPFEMPEQGDYKAAKKKAIDNLCSDPLYYVKKIACCCDKCKQTQAEAEAKKGKDYKQKKAEGQMTKVEPGQKKVKTLQENKEDHKTYVDKEGKKHYYRDGKWYWCWADDKPEDDVRGSIQADFQRGSRPNVDESTYTEKRASFTEDDKVSVQLVQAIMKKTNPETGKRYTQAEARKKAAKMIKNHKKKQLDEVGDTLNGQTKLGQLARRKAKQGDKAAEKEIDNKANREAEKADKKGTYTKDNMDFHYQRGRYFNLEESKMLRESIEKTIERILSEAATNNLAALSDQNANIQELPGILNSLENIVTEIESFIIKEHSKIQSVFDSIGNIKNEDNIPVGYKFVQPILDSLKQDLEPVLAKVTLDDLNLPEAPQESGEELNPGMPNNEPGMPEDKQTVFSPKGEKPQLAEQYHYADRFPVENASEIENIASKLKVGETTPTEIPVKIRVWTNNQPNWTVKIRRASEDGYNVIHKGRTYADTPLNDLIDVIVWAVIRTNTNLLESKQSKRYTK